MKAAHVTLVLFIAICLPQQGCTSSNQEQPFSAAAIDTIEFNLNVRGTRGDAPLHLQVPEFFKIGDDVYVRMYQSLYKATDATDTRLPSTEHKDIWQDNEGHIIIKPQVHMNDNGVITHQEYLWLGMGEIRNQLKFLHGYRTQDNPIKADPVIRSFLVKYETVKEILSSRHMTTEPFSTKLNLDMNVDLYLPNQFGFGALSTEQIRQNTLPHSLVTFVADDTKAYPVHMGIIKSERELRSKFDIPDYDVPGIYKVGNSKLRSEYYANIANHLEELDLLYQRQRAGELGISEEIDNKLNTYKDTFHATIEKEELYMTAAWAKDARKRIEMNDNYFNSDPREQEVIRVKIEEIKDIRSDFMFDSEVDLKIYGEYIKAGERYREVLKSRSRFLTLMESFYKDLKLMIDENKRFNQWLKGLSQDNLLENGLSSDQINALKLGFPPGMEEFDESDAKQKILGGITDKITDNEKRAILSQHMDTFFKTNSLDVIPTKIAIAFSNPDAIFLQDKHPDSLVLVVKNNRLYKGETPYIISTTQQGIELVVAYDKQNMQILSDILPANVADQRIKRVAFQPTVQPVDLQQNDFEIRNFLAFVDKVSRANILVDGIVIPLNDGRSLMYDVIANKMFMDSEDLGTPRILYEGYITHNDVLMDRESVAQLQKMSGGLTELQEQKKTGVWYFKEKDTVIDAKYLAMESDNDRDSPLISKLFIERDNVRKGRITRKQKTPYKYRYEKIIRIGNSEEAVKASEYLFRRYEKEGKKVHLVTYDNNFLDTIKGDPNGFQVSKVTRISVIGHGSGSGNELKVGSHNGVELANIIKQHVLTDNDAQKGIGKISIIACNLDNEVVSASQRGELFGKSFVRVLRESSINTIVAIRTGYIQVDAEGHKQYGSLIGSHMQWQYRENMPQLMRMDEQGIVEYGTITFDKNKKSTIIWSKTPTEAENGKVLIVSKASGTLDTASDVKVSKLHAIQALDQASGTLNIPDSIISDITISDNVQFESGEGEHRTILDVSSDAETTPSNRYIPFDESGVQASLVQLEASVWADKLAQATKEALHNMPDKDQWVPLIDSAVEDNLGNTKVTLMNMETFQETVVTMKNNAYVQFKKRTARYAMSVKELPSFSKTSIGMTGSGAFMGTGFFIYSVIQMSRAKDCEQNITCPTTQQGKRLAESLKIHAYVGITQGSFGMLTDSVQVAELAVSFQLSKKATNGIATMSKSTSKFLKFSKVVGKIGAGVGAIGGVVSLAFSADQLAHAQTQAQKVQFGVQVAIDSVNLVVSGVAIGAAIAAAVTGSATASAIAAAAGPIGFVVAIVGILASTITGLAFEFKDTRKNAGLVGEYFYNLDQVYSKGGFDFDISSATLSIPPFVIAEELDTTTGTITLDSQYIYRTKHGWTGSGKKNYFFWYKHFPKMVEDKAQAINIREGIGYGKHHYLGHRNVSNLVLPIVPKSYISYEYSRLPFCTAMHDKGFDIIRRLENDYRFDYDFYIAPGEQIVSSLEHEYVKTYVKIKLSKDVKTVIIPKAPTFMQGHHQFTLETSSPQHQVILNDGVSVILKNLGTKECTWLLDIRNVTNQGISFEGNTLMFGNTSVLITHREDIVYLIDIHGGVVKVHLDTETVAVQNVDFRATTSSVSKLQEYLTDLSTKMGRNQEHIIINNFVYAGQYIGRAYYEIQSNRFLFSDFKDADVSSKFKENARMLGQVGRYVYYMSVENEQRVIWWADANNHTIGASYHLYCGNEGFDVTRLNMQSGFLYLVQTVEDVSLIYMINPEEIKLISIDGTQENVYKLGKLCFNSLLDHLPTFEAQVSQKRYPGTCIYARTVPILPLKQTTSDGIHQHFWLYMNDTEAVEHYQDGVFCNPSKPPVAVGIIKPNITNECDDLTLRDIKSMSSGEEAYFFFCEANKTMFYQVNGSAAAEVLIPGGVDEIEDNGHTKMIKSKNGCLYVFDESGNFSLAAVPFSSLAEHDNWKASIGHISNQSLTESLILILGMKTTEGKGMIAWYDISEEHMIIVSPALEGTDIVYLGSTASANLVWLYDQQHGQVILQQVLDDQEIEALIQRLPLVQWTSNIQALFQRSPLVQWTSNTQPSGKVVLTGLNSAEYRNGEIFGVSQAGVIVNIDRFSAVNLLGVNQTWMNNNKDDLVTSLSQLCISYDQKGVITLGHEEVSNTSSRVVFNWFHCAWDSLLTVPSENGIKLSYLGQNVKEKLVYFSGGEDTVLVNLSNSNTNNKIKRSTDDKIDGSSDQNNLNMMYAAKVQGSTLLIQAPAGSYVGKLPILDDVVSLVLTSAQSLEIHVNTEVWLHYKSIMVTSIGSDGPQNSLISVDAPYPCDYPWTVLENDTVFVDRSYSCAG